MASFPFRYYKALRDEYILEMAIASAAPKEEDEQSIDFDAEVLRGEFT